MGALETHQGFIAAETLATQISILVGSGELGVGETGSIAIEIEKAG